MTMTSEDISRRHLGGVKIAEIACFGVLLYILESVNVENAFILSHRRLYKR